jgi:hypothetical protein
MGCAGDRVVDCSVVQYTHQSIGYHSFHHHSAVPVRWSFHCSSAHR